MKRKNKFARTAAQRNVFGGGLFLLGLLSSATGNIAQAANNEPVPPPDVTSDQPEEQIEEIVVTAQKRSESIKDVPISISAFSGDDLARLAVTQPQDLQFTTPGLTFPQDNETLSPYIRGRGTAFSGIGLEGPVSVYIDDSYLESQFGATGMVDVSQIQVLNGPQGTLYGRNATGGAVLITTANPARQREGYVKAGYGNYGAATADAMLNLPLGDTLAMRIVGSFERRGGYVTDTVDGTKHGEYDRKTVRGKLLWQPVDQFTSVLKVEYQKMERQYLRQLLYYGTGAPSGLGFYDTIQSPVNPSDRGGENDIEVSTYNLQTTWQNELLSLNNTVAFRDLGLSSCADDDNIYVEAVNFCTSYATTTNQNKTALAYDHTLTDELRLSSKFSGPVNFLTGYSYQYTNAHFAGVLDGLAFGGLVPVFDNYTAIHSWAAYAEGYYQPIKPVKLTIGGRYTRDQKSLEVANNPDSVLVNQVPANQVRFGQSQSWSKFTPRIVLAYDVDNVNIYASYNSAFKSGGFNVPTPSETSPLNPEKTTGVEIGAKLKLLDNRARFNVAAFTGTTKNVQVASIDVKTGTVVQQNAAEVRARGVESSFDIQVRRDLSFSTGVSYLDSIFKSFPDATVYAIPAATAANPQPVLVSSAEDLGGTVTPLSPKWSANASATYTLGLMDGWLSRTTFSGHYSGKYEFNPGAGGQLNADKQGNFAIFNATGSIDSPLAKVTLEWYVKNMLDRGYYDRIQTSASSGVYAVTAEPRTFGGSIRYNFF